MKGVACVALPMPADFPQIIATMTNAQAKAHYGVGDKSLQRWRRQAGVVGEAPKLDSAPDGFAQSTSIMTMNELCRAYGIGLTRARRWCKELEVWPRRAVRSSQRVKLAPQPVVRPMTRTDFAADYLRRYGPVYRCDAKGAFSPIGQFYSRGGRVLTGDEVIARATRLGWQSADLGIAA